MQRIAVLIVCSLVGACGVVPFEETAASATRTGSECGPASGVVATVLDGDTIVLESGLRVRYLLVDTPEISQEQPACYGPDAAEFNARLVSDQTVYLQYEEHCADDFGRLLAYVSREGVDINAKLIAQGYGCVLHIPPTGDQRVQDYRVIEALAAAEGRGLWSHCDPVPCR